MIYNDIAEYRSFLETSLSVSTARTYAGAVATLLRDQNITSVNNINIEKVIEYFESFGNIKYKNQYSKYKNAFLKFCDFMNIELDKDSLNKIYAMTDDKKKKRRNLKKIDFKKVNNRINLIRDNKLKLSFVTMLNTGLRVSELSQVKKSDCKFESDSLKMNFIGKGGDQEFVIIYQEKDKTFFDRISVLLNETSEDEKVFYSTGYLQKEANKREFGCHDLRRAFAKISYKECKSMIEVKKLLRHKEIKNTKIYLKSKVKL